MLEKKRSNLPVWNTLSVFPLSHSQAYGFPSLSPSAPLPAEKAFLSIPNIPAPNLLVYIQHSHTG